ncbi:hypothetical protein B0H11DRAFT_2036379, partial [Mycena galericulata]
TSQLLVATVGCLPILEATASLARLRGLRRVAVHTQRDATAPRDVRVGTRCCPDPRPARHFTSCGAAWSSHMARWARAR